ncbi:putative choline kinase [Aspergillus novofumigatus IBT 16806]|uniref:Uncharacterized protein n=1 Tax=Aspergillus novofumigatus (strain IBT 16806) TaxID=1392255 RepID=A0A2I1BSR6_ASPN1|nr:uncharacterized protein P174DRAFT_508195 [Aspergillus novofumigatus IBT 16806]PKX88438.1 hypothetical protein P174DRAFT_508195 [Aspergillus novofumigatus IBT 16806]
MATAIPVPVTLPEDKVPTKRNVRDIIGTFLTGEWPSVEPETLTVSYHASFVNGHCPVERPKPDTGTPTEPLKVFIKFHNDTSGGLEIFEPLVPTKHEEALFCYEYGQTGLGAKVYGFFKTQDGTLGRVEEFLDARNMEPEDVENSVIRADVARGLAIFHVMKTSLEKRTVESYYDAIINGLGNYHRAEKLKALGKEGGVMIDNLVDYNFGKRLRNVVDKLASIGERPDGNYRAFDIGGHFMQKMFKWFDEESKIAKSRKYTEKEKKHFCDEYAQQWNQLTGDLDTGDQVFLESEYGYLLAITFDIHNMLCFMYEQGDKDPLNLLGLNKLFDEFVNQRYILKKGGDLLLELPEDFMQLNENTQTVVKDQVIRSIISLRKVYCGKKSIIEQSPPISKRHDNERSSSICWQHTGWRYPTITMIIDQGTKVRTTPSYFDQQY